MDPDAADPVANSSGCGWTSFRLLRLYGCDCLSDEATQHMVEFYWFAWTCYGNVCMQYGHHQPHSGLIGPITFDSSQFRNTDSSIPGVLEGRKHGHDLALHSASLFGHAVAMAGNDAWTMAGATPRLQNFLMSRANSVDFLESSGWQGSPGQPG